MTMKIRNQEICLETFSGNAAGGHVMDRGTSRHFYFDNTQDRQPEPNTGDPARLPG